MRLICIALLIGCGSVSSVDPDANTESPIEAPTGVVAVADIASAARVSFTPPDDPEGRITGYRIVSEPDGIETVIDDPSVTTAITSGLTVDTEYRFTVTATSDSGDGLESAPSDPVVAVAGPAPPPRARACGGNQSALVVTTAPDAGLTYNLYFATEPGVTKLTGEKIENVPSSFDHAGLVNGSSYHYVLEAVDSAGIASLDSPEAVANVGAVGDILFATSFSTTFPRIEIIDCASLRETGYQGPDRLIEGPTTGISNPSTANTVFVDTDRGELYLADRGSATIRIWQGVVAIDGDVAPDRVITSTAFVDPSGITIDTARDRMYVSQRGGTSGPTEVLVFDDASTADGDTDPVARITNLARPHVAVDGDNDRLYISNDPLGAREVLVFDTASALAGDVDFTARDRAFAVEGWALRGISYDGERDRLYVASRDTGGSVYVVGDASSASGVVVEETLLSGGGMQAVVVIDTAGDILHTMNDSGTSVRAWDGASSLAGDVGEPDRTLLLELTSGGGVHYVKPAVPDSAARSGPRR